MNDTTAGATWPQLTRNLVAILRGLDPEKARDTGLALVEAGFQAIEVPLNSPDPFRSIETLAKACPDALIGAGTVLKPADVDRLHDAGGRLLVSPNINVTVLARAHHHGMVTMPGVFSPTEALAAVAAGASALKFFPASVLGPDGIAAIMAVLPHGTIVGAVGGVTHHDFGRYHERGISVFGLGSSIFKPGMALTDIRQRARVTIETHDATIAQVHHV